VEGLVRWILKLHRTHKLNYWGKCSFWVDSQNTVKRDY